MTAFPMMPSAGAAQTGFAAYPGLPVPARASNPVSHGTPGVSRGATYSHTIQATRLYAARPAVAATVADPAILTVRAGVFPEPLDSVSEVPGVHWLHPLKKTLALV